MAGHSAVSKSVSETVAGLPSMAALAGLVAAFLLELW